MATIANANHNGFAAAILKILLDRIRQRRGQPQATENALVIVEIGDRDRLIDRTLERPAYESGDCGCGAFDRCLGPQLSCGVSGGNHQLGQALSSKPNANVAQRRRRCARAKEQEFAQLLVLVLVPVLVPMLVLVLVPVLALARRGGALLPQPRVVPLPACSRFPPA